MIQIIVQAQKASCRKSSGERITTGMVGKQVSFDFSAEWDGLVKTAVFEGSGVTKDVTLSGDTAVIPHECLTAPGGMLRVGVFGTDGTIQTPTVYTDIGQIEQGADPSGDTSEDPTLPIWAQLQAMIGDLGNLTTTAKENLVAAVNEAAKSGGGGGAAADVRMQVAGGYIQYSSDGGANWNNLIAVAELIGAPGKTAYDYAVEAGYTGTEAEFSDRMAAEIPTALPNPNSLTFTGAVTGSYDGSEDLTVEIPSGGGGSNLPIPTAEDVGKVPVVQGDLSFGLGEIGVGDWEVIADQTLVEEAASVSFDFDVTYRRLRFIVYGVPASGSNATLDVRFNGSIDKQRIQLSNGLQSFNTSDGVNKRAAQIYLEKINGYIAFALCSVNGGNENPNAMMYSPSIDSKKVDWIDIYKVVFYAANTSFSAGSIFKLWGCK